MVIKENGQEIKYGRSSIWLVRYQKKLKVRLLLNLVNFKVLYI